jgi:hypothetical protein
MLIKTMFDVEIVDDNITKSELNGRIGDVWE